MSKNPEINVSDLFALSRDQQLDIIYEGTHNDFKGLAGINWPVAHHGKRTILSYDNGATVLVLLENLSEEEIAQKLPLAKKMRDRQIENALQGKKEQGRMN